MPPPVQIISDLSKKFNAGEQKFNTWKKTIGLIICLSVERLSAINKNEDWEISYQKLGRCFSRGWRPVLRKKLAEKKTLVFIYSANIFSILWGRDLFSWAARLVVMVSSSELPVFCRGLLFLRLKHSWFQPILLMP